MEATPQRNSNLPRAYYVEEGKGGTIMRKKIVHAIGMILAVLGILLSFVLAGGEELSPLGVIITEVGGIAALFFGAWLVQL